MVWNRQIYVATASLGVYYTSDFTDPGTQPTWTAVNTGLGAVDCREFWLDPFEPADRQYVMISTGRVLYRRINQGDWVEILSNASLQTLTGRAVIIGGFCIDPLTPGRLWVLYAASYNGTNSQYRLARSDNYGDSWTTLLIYSSNFNFTYAHLTVRAVGDILFAPLSTGTGGHQRVYYSSNAGASWDYYDMGFNALRPLALNSLTPNSSYNQNVNDGNALARITTAGIYTKLQDSIGPERWDSMWFHPTDADHHRIFYAGIMYTTVDEWTNTANAGAIAPVPISFAPSAGNDTDQMLVGLTLGTHVIGCLTSEADTTATGIAGTNAGSAPYTNSIPNTCGGLARMGIQSVPFVTYLYTYDVLYQASVNNDTVHPIGITFQAETNNDSVHTSNVAME